MTGIILEVTVVAITLGKQHAKNHVDIAQVPQDQPLVTILPSQLQLGQTGK